MGKQEFGHYERKCQRKAWSCRNKVGVISVGTVTEGIIANPRTDKPGKRGCKLGSRETTFTGLAGQDELAEQTEKQQAGRGLENKGDLVPWKQIQKVPQAGTSHLCQMLLKGQEG